MGTNYYAYGADEPEEKMHLGKSSGGWCFSLRIYPEQGIHDLSDWLEILGSENTLIEDEYGGILNLFEFLTIVEDRKGNETAYAKISADPAFFSMNHAEPGPNYLVRHKLEHGCVKHGQGTWDCIESEFC